MWYILPLSIQKPDLGEFTEKWAVNVLSLFCLFYVYLSPRKIHYVFLLPIHVGKWLWLVLKWWFSQEHLDLIKNWSFQREVAPKCSWNPCDFILLLWVFFFFSVHTSFIYLTLPRHIRQYILTSSGVSTHSSNTTPFVRDGIVFIEFVRCLFKAESIFSCRHRPTLKSVMVLSLLLYKWHHV